MTYRNKQGKLHREDGPAYESASGHKEWWVNGKRHRIDGPAVITSEYTTWYVNGKRHRLDGPAYEDINRLTEWWVNDDRMDNRKRFQSRTGVSDEEMVMIILKYGEVA